MYILFTRATRFSFDTLLSLFMYLWFSMVFDYFYRYSAWNMNVKSNETNGTNQKAFQSTSRDAYRSVGCSQFKIHPWNSTGQKRRQCWMTIWLNSQSGEPISSLSCGRHCIYTTRDHWWRRAWFNRYNIDWMKITRLPNNSYIIVV